MTMDTRNTNILLVQAREVDHLRVAAILDELRKPLDLSRSGMTARTYTPPIGIDAARNLVGNLLSREREGHISLIVTATLDSDSFILWGDESDHTKVQALFEQIWEEVEKGRAE